MTFWQLMLHLLNFVLPALAMALLMPWAGRWVIGSGRRPWHQHMLWHFLAGVAVLLLGLLWQGNDGAMATYGALVLVAATLEWALLRARTRRKP